MTTPELIKKLKENVGKTFQLSTGMRSVAIEVKSDWLYYVMDLSSNEDNWVEEKDFVVDYISTNWTIDSIIS